MKFARFIALLAALLTSSAITATSVSADLAGVSTVDSDILLTEFDPATGVYSVIRQSADGTGTLLFVTNGQIQRVFSGGGKIGVATRQEMTFRGKEVLKSIVWDISTPSSPAVVAKATFLKQVGKRKFGCGGEVDLLGISAAGEFVVRSGTRERHAKRKRKCTPDYLVKKRRARVPAHDRTSITLIGASRTVIQSALTLEATPSELPLADEPEAKTGGGRLVVWDDQSLTLRDFAKSAKANPFKFDRGAEILSVDIGESGNVIAAGALKGRRGFLVTGIQRSDLPNQFSGESYICGERIVEVARSPIVIDGKITSELAAIEWDFQGNMLKTTSIGKDHFAVAFACNAANAYVIRQTVPAKRAELIPVKLG